MTLIATGFAQIPDTIASTGTLESERYNLPVRSMVPNLTKKSVWTGFDRHGKIAGILRTSIFRIFYENVLLTMCYRKNLSPPLQRCTYTYTMKIILF